MDFGQLKGNISSISHRPDLATSMPLFVDTAREKINRRFRLALVSFTTDTDTNAVLTECPLIYIYASLQALHEFINNGDNAIYYKSLWDDECSLQNISGGFASTDPLYIDTPPVITPEP